MGGEELVSSLLLIIYISYTGSIEMLLEARLDDGGKALSDAPVEVSRDLKEPSPSLALSLCDVRLISSLNE